jgi:hypothetical protein
VDRIEQRDGGTVGLARAADDLAEARTGLIVVDASVLSNAIADDGADGRRARGELRAAGDLAAPDLVDVETIAVLRKRWLADLCWQDRRAYSAPTTLKFWLTKTWCGQLTPMMWTLYSPSLSNTTRLTVPPGYAATAAALALFAAVPVMTVPVPALKLAGT